MRRIRRFSYQYRLVWKYRAEKRARLLVSDRPNAIRRMLRRVGSDKPELGVTPTQLKRSWAWLARRLDVGFEAVSHIEPREILFRLRDSFPRLEYVRVEQRQVGPWVEMLDPLNNLMTGSTLKAEEKRAALLERVQAMTREELDAWRWVPDEQAQAVRIRGQNRESR
jgi:hypothetical protein